MDKKQLMLAIDFCIDAHENYSIRPGVRRWDKETPYFVHPVWCAMAFLQETSLSGDAKQDREDCAFALLFHDLKEDTSVDLPEWLSQRAVELIGHMTISREVGSTEKEIAVIWNLPSIVSLLKLYDKASNLLDGSWMSNEKWNNQYVPYVLRLADDVETNYGDLNIVRMARAVAVPRSVQPTQV